MTFLVTGATGFIGQRLIRRLLGDGHAVFYLARKRHAAMDSRAAFFCWKQGEPPPLDCMPPLNAVINLAGEPVAQRWTDKTKRAIRDSRVNGTRSLVDAIGQLKQRPLVLVSASAIGYYGDRGAELLDETSAPANDFLAQVCVAWETEAERAREFGVRVVPVRLAIVLGRGRGALSPMLPFFRAGLGASIGNGQQWMSWVHVDDVVNLFCFAATHSHVTEALNASSPNPVQNREFTRELAHALHRPALFSIPVFALRLAMGEVAKHAAASSRVIAKRTQELGFEFSFPQLPAALAEIVES